MSNICCYVINLADREDRRRLIGSRLAAEGLTPIFFEAHSGKACDAAEGFLLKDGERGCFSSHRSLLRRISEGDERAIHLVLEDDAVFVSGFSKRLQDAIAQLPEDWGYFQAGWLPTSMEKGLLYRIRHRLASMRWFRVLMRLLGMKIGVNPPLGIAERPAVGTHCYVVKPWFARKMVACLGSAPFAPVDFYFRFVWDVDSTGMYKARFPLSGQDWLLGSDVDPERFAGAKVQVDDRGNLVRPDKSG